MNEKKRLEELYRRLNALMRDLREEDAEKFIDYIKSRSGENSRESRFLRDLLEVSESFHRLAAFIERKYSSNQERNKLH